MRSLGRSGFDDDDGDDSGAEDGAGERPLAGAARAPARALAALYAKADALLGHFACPASGACCQLARTGREPYLFPVELQALETAVGGRWPAERADGGCPFLDPSGRRCSVYAHRPFGCRTYFCERVAARPGPGPRRLPTAQLLALTARLTSLSDESAPGAHPRPLRELVAQARGRRRA